MTKYEHKIAHLPFRPTDPRNEHYLDAIGLQGWELVSASAFQRNVRVGKRLEPMVEQICYFRRPAAPEPEVFDRDPNQEGKTG